MLVSNVRTQTEKNRYQLPNGLRETLLQGGYEKALLVIEGMYYLKYAGDTWLSCEQIYRLLSDNFGMSFRLVYEGLRSSFIFQRRKAGGRANQRGARPYLYRLPYPEELQAEFAPDLDYTPHDELQREDLKSVKSYLMALHRELVIRMWVDNGGKGVEMHRDFQADRINRSVRTIRSYEKELNFSNTPNFDKKVINWENWDSLPRYKNKYDFNGKRLPSRKWLEAVDWKTGEVRVLPHVKYLAYVALKAGLEVYELERQANTYYPYQKPDTSQFESTWDINYYYAELEARRAAGLYQKSDGSWYHQRE